MKVLGTARIAVCIASRSLDIVGKLWTLPNSMVGMLIGTAALPFGARITLGDNAIRFERLPFGCGALALGNVVLYANGALPTDCRRGMYGDDRLLNLGRHEAAHTFQYQVLGPLFVPVYLLCGGISARNPFERAANDYAAGGSWWPARRATTSND
jgi:hypothetical protein